MRWWFALLAATSWAESYSIEPQRPVQGQVLKVFAPPQAGSARLNGKTIRLFPHSDGRSLGLMPIGVLTKPGRYTLEWLDGTGGPVHQEAITIADAHFKKQNVTLSKALLKLHATPDEREAIAAFLKNVSAVRYWQEPFVAPVAGCITSPFGVTRLHNGRPTGDYHAGLDQRGAFGSPVHAVAGGIVRIAQPFELRGGTVALDHGQGLASIYLHLSRFAVKPGDEVKPGDVIGYVGSSGRSTGPHLHWTLYANGDPVNPLQWISLKPCPVQTPKRRAPRVSP